MEPTKCPLGKGETSTNHPIFGFHVNFRGGYFSFRVATKRLWIAVYAVIAKKFDP